MSTSALSTASTTSAAPRKSLWDSVLTSTPVLLTVLATLLAGLSSSEMTQAQYHRSLAAQFQSKVGDQWGFFQAKRIRGTNLEMTVDLLHAVSSPGPVNADALQTAAALLPRECHRLEAETNRLIETLASAKGALGSAGEALQRLADRLLQLTATKVQEAEAAKTRMAEVLAQSAVQDAFSYLSTSRVPSAREIPIENSQIRQVLPAIQARQTEAETVPLIAAISEGALKQAIQTAEANLKAFEQADQPISKELERIDQLVQEQVSLARVLLRAVRDMSAAFAELPQTETRSLTELQSAMAALSRTSASLQTTVTDLSNDFRAARHAYTARRYRNEAHYNQEAAGLYEVQVRKSDLTSERHRLRSYYFFYCMLCAQAGVTIATLSLAVRRKSVLWSLASLAGMMAVALGFYVHTYM